MRISNIHCIKDGRTHHVLQGSWPTKDKVADIVEERRCSLLHLFELCRRHNLLDMVLEGLNISCEHHDSR